MKSKDEKIKHKNFVFDAALKHQLTQRVPRIEKIEVNWLDFCRSAALYIAFRCFPLQYV